MNQRIQPLQDMFHIDWQYLDVEQVALLLFEKPIGLGMRDKCQEESIAHGAGWDKGKCDLCTALTNQDYTACC